MVIAGRSACGTKCHEGHKPVRRDDDRALKVDQIALILARGRYRCGVVQQVVLRDRCHCKGSCREREGTGSRTADEVVDDTSRSGLTRGCCGLRRAKGESDAGLRGRGRDHVAPALEQVQVLVRGAVPHLQTHKRGTGEGGCLQRGAGAE